MRRGMRPWQATAGALALLGAAAAGAAAQDSRRAVNGAVVPTPKIESLDCAQMQATLDAIDSSDYRGPAPVPEDHPDRAIFEYENDLSALTFERCITPEAILQDAAEAFGHGFEAAPGEAEAATLAAEPAAPTAAAPAAPAAAVSAGAVAAPAAEEPAAADEQ